MQNEVQYRIERAYVSGALKIGERKETEKIRIPATGGIVIRETTTTCNVLGWKSTESVWGNSIRKP